jgi:c-di-GMP-binding flagellar brake protein YcgR
MDQDRRAFLRVETDLVVSISSIEPGGERGPQLTATAVNLSAGGAKLTTATRPPAPVAPGERLWLEVQFALPRFLVFTEAEIVRVDADGFAVRFDELEQYTLQRVVRWVYAQDRRLFERRAQARIPVRLRALCRRIAPDGAAVEEFAAPTVDISLDGVRITSERLLDRDAAVDVELDFGDGLEPFQARTAVEPVGEAHGRQEYQLRLEEAHPALRRMLIERALAAERRKDS